MDIDADEVTAAGGAEGQCGPGIIPQHIEANGQPDRRAHSAAGSAHSGDGFGRDIGFCKWHVAEVFDEEGMRSAAFVGYGIRHGTLDDVRHGLTMARRTR